MPQIEKYVTESLRAEVLVRSTNQPQTSYAVAASLLEFKLKKILIDKMETNKSINGSDIQKNLYNALIEAYNLNKDIFTSYGDVVTLKRGRDDQDHDEDPFAGSDQGTKRRKSSKDDEPSKGSKSKESKDIPLDSVVVLRYEKRSKSENKGKVPTEMELELEQTQQSFSYEVSVSAKGVEELKRKVKIKGEKKEALLTLSQKSGQYICCQESQR
nr:hypothetical protein [Tanacetum cinerariifolium]